MKNTLHLLAMAALFAPLASAQAPQFEVESLVPPSAVANDQMGSELEIDSVRMCAGISNRSVPVNSAGAVATWPRVGSTFGPGSLLTSPTPTGNGRFGTAIALEGSELMVSEERSLIFGTQPRRAVHHYVDQGSGWVYVDSLRNSVPYSDGFGNSIARSGDLLAVGAPFDSSLAQLNGAVYLFRQVAGAWQLETLLTAGNAGTGHRFGSSVAIHSGRVFVGAPLRIVANQRVGAAYSFEMVGGSWMETGMYEVDPAFQDTGLGVSVDLTGDTAVIGAANTNDPGAVYVYERSGVNWNRVQRLRPDNLGDFATFGNSVAIKGDSLVVGAYQDTVVGHLTGSAWVFERSANAFAPVRRLVQDGPTTFFGFTVSLDGAGTYLVGRPFGEGENQPTTSGEIHVFRPEGPIGSGYCGSVNNSTQQPGRMSAFGSEMVVNDQVDLVAYQLPRNAFGIFITSQVQGFVANPGGSQGNLCLGGALGRYNLAGQIRNSGLIGMFSLELDLAAAPTPFGPVPMLSGQTWNFQAWYRDLVQGQSVSNFTDAWSISFQ